MKQDEIIKEMYTRFTDIVNDLKGLRKKLSIEKLMNKIPKSLLMSWEAKVTAMEEDKDLTKLSIKELIGSLTSYKIKVKDLFEEDDNQKKKSIALKTSTSLNSNNGDNKIGKKDGDDLVFIAKKIKKILSRRKEIPILKKSFKNKKEDQSKME